MIKVLIIEDEPRGRETLKNLLNDYCEDLEIVGLCSAVPESIHAIEVMKPDLVFLDIELHSGTGFEILESIEHFDFEVVFTTAFENYAIRAIKFSALDYLLKPIDITELREAVGKARKRREETWQNKSLYNLVKNLKDLNDNHKTITLSTIEGLEFIEVSDIIKLEANGSYTWFYLNQNRKLLVSKNLKEYENLLSDCKFYRVHHSCLINLSKVEKYVKLDGGYIVLKDGLHANISQKRKEKFFELMNLRSE
jgi:two-component system, LytTR family, response regulator